MQKSNSKFVKEYKSVIQDAFVVKVDALNATKQILFYLAEPVSATSKDINKEIEKITTLNYQNQIKFILKEVKEKALQIRKTASKSFQETENKLAECFNDSTLTSPLKNVFVHLTEIVLKIMIDKLVENNKITHWDQEILLNYLEETIKQELQNSKYEQLNNDEILSLIKKDSKNYKKMGKKPKQKQVQSKDSTTDEQKTSKKEESVFNYLILQGTDKLNELLTKVNELAANNSKFSIKIVRLTEEIRNIKEENRNIKEENRNIKEENKNIKEENRNIKEEIRNIKEEIRNIKEELKIFKFPIVCRELVKYIFDRIKEIIKMENCPDPSMIEAINNNKNFEIIKNMLKLKQEQNYSIHSLNSIDVSYVLKYLKDHDSSIATSKTISFIEAIQGDEKLDFNKQNSEDIKKRLLKLFE